MKKNEEPPKTREVDDQHAAELPDREAMSIVNPALIGGPTGPPDILPNDEPLPPQTTVPKA